MRALSHLLIGQQGAWQSITRIQLDKLSETAHQWHVRCAHTPSASSRLIVVYRAARFESRIAPKWPAYREELLAGPIACEMNALALLVPQELRIKKQRKSTSASSSVIIR